MYLEYFKQKYIPPEELEERADVWKTTGKTVATLNGSFDLLHAGHLEIIYQASLQADILLVALNSDSSIKQYKSADRPIVPLECRLQMVAALGFVDYVTSFEELDPRTLLEKVRPDVHVNGADYGVHCIEAETVRRLGARLHLVPLVPSLSTTSLITRICSHAPTLPRA